MFFLLIANIITGLNGVVKINESGLIVLGINTFVLCLVVVFFIFWEFGIRWEK